MAGFPARRRAAEALAEAERLRLAVAKATGQDPAEPPPVSDEPLTLAEAIRVASQVARNTEGDARDRLQGASLALKWQGLDAAPPRVEAPDDALDAALEAYKAGPDGLR